jgi:hypothetical protein
MEDAIMSEDQQELPLEAATASASDNFEALSMSTEALAPASTLSAQASSSRSDTPRASGEQYNPTVAAQFPLPVEHKWFPISANAQNKIALLSRVEEDFIKHLEGDGLKHVLLIGAGQGGYV